MIYCTACQHVHETPEQVADCQDGVGPAPVELWRFRNWDAVRPTAECPYCNGTGLAPGEGWTECGFCVTRDDLAS